MKIAFYPAATVNPYTEILLRGFREAGHEADFADRITGGAIPDVVHLHWIESFAMGRWAKRALPFARLAFAQMRFRIAQTRRRGGICVWTAHNAQPHERDSSLRARVIRTEIARIVGLADGIVALNAASVPVIRAAYPAARATIRVIAHPHYRECYPVGDGAGFRARHGIAADARVAAMIGLIRPYKRVLEAMALFAAAAAPGDRLVIAGDCFDADYAAALRAAAAADPRVLLLIGRLSDRDLADAHAAATLVLLTQQHFLNSGSALAALSFARPVLAYATGSLPEIRRDVGDPWLILRDPLTPGDLADALATAARRSAAAAPDLSLFAPEKIVAEHLALYRDLLDRRSPAIGARA